jgi:hypothetical protein
MRNKTDGPLATIGGRWRNLARPIGRRRGRTRIVLRGGTYALDQPLMLMPEDSGLVISAYKRETPIVTGEARLTGWRIVPPSILICGRRRRPAAGGSTSFLSTASAKGAPGSPATGFYRCVDGPIKDQPNAIALSSGRREGIVGARRRGGIGPPGGVGAIAQCDSRSRYCLQHCFARRRTCFPTTPSRTPAITSRMRRKECGRGAMAPGCSRRALVTYWPEAGEDVSSARITAPRLYDLAHVEGRARYRRCMILYLTG